MNLITEDVLFVSVSYVTGEGLTWKLSTHYWSVAAVQESDGKPNGEVVNFVLAAMLNNVNRVHPAFIAMVEIGMSYAAIHLASEESNELNAHSPHGSKFLPPQHPC